MVDGGQNPGKELFDIIADPAEQKNVIQQHPDVAAKLPSVDRALRARPTCIPKIGSAGLCWGETNFEVLFAG